MEKTQSTFNHLKFWKELVMYFYLRDISSSDKRHMVAYKKSTILFYMFREQKGFHKALFHHSKLNLK